MKDTIIHQCLDILKSDEITNDLKMVCRPLTDTILNQVYPYIYVIEIKKIKYV